MSDHPQDDSRRTRGEQTLSRIHAQTGEGVVAALKEIAPDFAGMLVDFPFGDVYSRPGLDLRSRQIATISALVTLGHAERELRWHVRGGLNVGLTRDEIVEIVMQMAVYAGFPAAVNALFVVRDVFAEMDDETQEEMLQDDA